MMSVTDTDIGTHFQIRLSDKSIIIAKYVGMKKGKGYQFRTDESSI